jgi:hypothetical protein
VIDDVIVLSEWLKSDDGACCKLLGTLTPDPVINGEGAGIAIRKGEDRTARSSTRPSTRSAPTAPTRKSTTSISTSTSTAAQS